MSKHIQYIKDDIHDLRCPGCGVVIELDEQDEHGLGHGWIPEDHRCHNCNTAFHIYVGFVAELKDQETNCIWKFDKELGAYETKCKNLFMFNVDLKTEMAAGFKFCPYCNKKIEVK